MASSFFGQYGNEIEFQEESDFNKKLPQLDPSVPGRTEGRTTEHGERNSLIIYLKDLHDKGFLRYPFKITKGEAPDFLILYPNGRATGVEETQAGSEDYQRAMTELERRPQGTLLEADLFRIENAPLAKGTYSKALRGPCEKLVGDGWEGDSMEKEWVQIIKDAIVKKTKKLNKSHFRHADKYELLVYDNSHVSGVNIGKAIPMLEKSLGNDLNLKHADRKWNIISVIEKSQVVKLTYK